MPVPRAEHTVAFVADPSLPPANFAGHRPSGLVLDEELRRLLRSRLVLVHLLALAYIVLLATLSFLVPNPEEYSSLRPDEGNPRGMLPVLIGESLLGAVVLWRSPKISLRALRLWELVLFVVQAAYYGDFRFRLLAYADGGSPLPTSLSVGFRAAVSLFGFMTLILAYGVLIPNSRRRSLIGVAALTAVPFAVLAVAAAVNPALRGTVFLGLTVQAAADLLFPAGIAVFAAARVADLQRRAFEAERRAEQVGQYALKRKLGEGGMGEVYLAEHRLLKRPCAVKLIRPELAANPTTAARFAREVQAVTGLTHFNTVRVYDYGRSEDGSFYFVMEYLDGPTLEVLIRDHGLLSPGRAVYLLRQLCGALAEAHAAGLVHRDLKPGNVIVARLGGMCDVAKLLDFGLVLDESSADPDDRLTLTGVVLGTPAFMAPEQAAGQPVDARGDVYSLGAVAFYAMTGRPPFEGKSALSVMADHRATPAPPLDGAPADLAAVVARCLAKSPGERFPTAGDLGRALARCACAADWSAERAAAWWEGLSAGGASPAPTEPARAAE